MPDRSAKGNPASKRMSNAVKKATRARSWARGQRRKADRVKAQEARAEKNRAIRDDGGLTPWEVACEVRADMRDHDPKVISRREKLGRAA